MPSYWLGIDLGTTYTAAAIARPAADGVDVQLVPLSGHSHAMPSVLFLPDEGSLVVGEDAQSRSLTDPYRAVREFKSRMGDEIPLLVGGSPYYAHDLAAGFVGWLCQYVAQREGERPQAVALTCPASWGPEKTAQFERAVQDTGLANVTMLTEPQAAAISYAGRAHLAAGATLAVYDLGAARFDVTVLRNDPPGRFTALGRSEGIEGLGGLSFDEVLFEYVCAAAGVPVEEMDPYDRDLAAEVAQLRRECIEAKETLSVSADAIIPVTLGGVQHWVRLTRAEFEEMIRPDLDRTVDAMHRAFGSADVVAAGLDAIVLTGGSAQIPLVSQLIAAQFGRVPVIDADPKLAVAIGAALFSAPAGAPARDAALLAAGAGGESRLTGLIAPLRHPSRKALLAAAALVIVVIGGGVTALRTPVLSGLTSHHGGSNGNAASGSTNGTGASGIAPSATGSPAPSAQSSAKPASKAPTATAASGGDAAPAGPSSAAAAAAQSSNKVTSPAKATKSSTPKPSASTSHPVTRPPTVKPTTPVPVPTTSSPTPNPPTPTATTPVPTPSTPTSTDTSTVAPSASAATTSVAPSAAAAAEA